MLTPTKMTIQATAKKIYTLDSFAKNKFFIFINWIEYEIFKRLSLGFIEFQLITFSTKKYKQTVSLISDNVVSCLILIIKITAGKKIKKIQPNTSE